MTFNVSCNDVMYFMRIHSLLFISFKNGSLTRESIRDKYASSDWSKFEQLLAKQPIGNGGNIGLYYTICEIIPSNVEGCYYFDENDVEVDDFSASTHVRALIEGQFLSRRVHAEDMGFQLGNAHVLVAVVVLYSQLDNSVMR